MKGRPPTPCPHVSSPSGAKHCLTSALPGAWAVSTHICLVLHLGILTSLVFVHSVCCVGVECSEPSPRTWSTPAPAWTAGRGGVEVPSRCVILTKGTLPSLTGPSWQVLVPTVHPDDSNWWQLTVNKLCSSYLLKGFPEVFCALRT